MRVVHWTKIQDFEFSKRPIFDSVSVKDLLAFAGISVSAEPDFAVPNGRVSDVFPVQTPVPITRLISVLVL